jgi:hypothetical protein
MNAKQIREQLEAIAHEDDFVRASYPLVGRWKDAAVGAEAVEPVLEFMERHPEIDYGTPGPLVSFIESDFRAGRDERSAYQKLVVQSVERKPTAHTLWLLNRLINVAGEPAARASLLGTMQNALKNPAADAAAKEEAQSFLDYQAGKDAE